MGKFVIECPNCGTYNQASDSFFSRNVIECRCGKLINIKREKMKSIECPHCKNHVIYDQSKGKKAVCPICKEKLVSDDSMRSAVEIKCPSCACELTVDKNGKTYECPLCKANIDVQEQIKKQKIQKDGMVSVIKYEGPNDVFVWKHPIEDFNLGSQLIVHESQEAIFFKDGKALDCFGAGRYTLATNNIPLLKELYKLPSGSQEVFHSSVYFINQTVQMGVKWGTDSKVRLFDPFSGLYIELGACGQFSIRVNNSRKLLLKLVGTTSGFNQSDILGTDYSTKGMTGKFKALIINRVKTLLAKTIKEKNINVLELDEHIEDISNTLKESINKVLDDYGLLMPEFYVTSIITPDDDPNFKRLKQQYAEKYLLIREENIKREIAEAEQQRRIVEAQTEAQEQIIQAQTEAQGTLIQAQAEAEAYRLQAQAEAQEMQMKGYTYQQETQREVGLAAVTNLPSGSGTSGTVGNVTGLVGDMVNLGVGLGVVGEVVNTVKGTVVPAISGATSVGSSVSEVVNPDVWECPNCHAKSKTPFCPQCGTKKIETKPQVGWNCACGAQNILSPFCPQCGSKKPEPDTWDCSCGQTGITTPFCPQCGNKKGE